MNQGREMRKSCAKEREKGKTNSIKTYNLLFIIIIVSYYQESLSRNGSQQKVI